ncbi:DNA recombination protein RmuC [Ideonella sp. DXS29W]|uniref:DNA recombination protein RmuC n=1 Tax=Ideonella lacteola TaxID=2984193 RepID=A0ABU9BW74_9BURK
MTDWILLALAALNLLVLIFIGLSLRQRGDGEQEAQALVNTLREAARADSDRVERGLRDELLRHAQAARSDLATFQQMLLNQSGDVARTQNEQIDSFRAQLGATQQLIADQLRMLGEANANRLAEVRGTVQTQLAQLQEGNERKLEQMRATVDEKLHATLEQRLGESFKQVAERLEAVHQGLGDMRNMARDVGSLNRVLTNVKTRGLIGEYQLGGLLEQVFTPEQYGANVETVPGSGARVEFAIRLPGRRDDGAPLWLPIDAKFPREDYERLLDAQDRVDPVAAESAAKAIESRLRLEAKTIREKYIAAPHTTDFGILFVPTEGLYAEALRRPGLVESLQREHRITLAGPTTLLATLNSLQMGFRTLALERRSAEVWEVLGAVKSEFQKFGDVLAKTKKKLDEASRTIDDAEVRTRQMARKLKSVETLPEAHAKALLGGRSSPDLFDEGAEGDA